VFPIDAAVTYFSEANKSDNVSELRVIGVTVSDSEVNLVESVKSDEGQISLAYLVSLNNRGTPTPLLLEISACKV
jgi:hypothetical protein